MPRNVTDIDVTILALWEKHRQAVDFWTRIDTLLDVRLTLMGVRHGRGLT